MGRLLSFRQKILLGQGLLFLLFAALLIPFVEKMVERTLNSTLEEATEQLVVKIAQASTVTEMITLLERQELFAFFRITLTDEHGELLYDSREEPTEVRENSTLVSQEFAYDSENFVVAGKAYTLRTAFPLSLIQEVSHSFELGFLFFGVPILFAFAALTWLIFSRTSRPIDKLISAITPFERGERDDLPRIDLGPESDDEFGRLAKIFNSLSDQVRRQIETAIAEKNEKQAILESLLEGVVAIDEQQIIRYVNFTATKMLGLPKKQLLSRTLASIEIKEKNSYRELLLEKSKELLKEAAEQECILTDTFTSGVESKLYFDLIAAPKAEHRGAILVIQDKSSQHKLLEVGKDFVANASHELRTPITIIKGFAETLQDFTDLSQEMLSGIVEKIVRNCQRMETLIKDLLILSDMENLSETRFHETDLFTLLEKERQMILAVYPDATITISSSLDSLLIDADSVLLDLALMNLLDNAAKYSRPPAQIAVELEADGSDAKITVSDKGIGIPKENLEYIFERFYTVNKARSRHLGGSGLGLSIVKNIIERHRGTVSVASEVGQGSTFTVRIPLQRSS